MDQIRIVLTRPLRVGQPCMTCRHIEDVSNQRKAFWSRRIGRSGEPLLLPFDEKDRGIDNNSAGAKIPK